MMGLNAVYTRNTKVLLRLTGSSKTQRMNSLESGSRIERRRDDGSAVCRVSVAALQTDDAFTDTKKGGTADQSKDNQLDKKLFIKIRICQTNGFRRVVTTTGNTAAV